MKKILLWLVVVIIVAVAGIILYGHQKIETLTAANTELTKQTAALEAEATAASEYETLLRAEYERCTTFIAQTAGDFREFEYCQKYLNLVSDVITTE